MNKRQFERLAKNLQSITRCPNCGARYALEDIRYFGQLGMTTFVQLICHNCQVPVFAGVPESQRLEETEEKSGQPVTYDDVIEVHKALENKAFDFEKLFG